MLASARDWIAACEAKNARAPVHQADRAAAVADRARLLPPPRGLGDAFAQHAQQGRERFVRRQQRRVAGAVEAQQQPAHQLPLDRVVPAADRGLRHLAQQPAHVAHHHLLERGVLAEFALRDIGAQQPRGAGGLHRHAAAVDHAFAQQRDADQPFVADAGEFAGLAPGRDVRDRGEAAAQEMDVGGDEVAVLQHPARGQVHGLQFGEEAEARGLGQAVQQAAQGRFADLLHAWCRSPCRERGGTILGGRMNARMCESAHSCTRTRT